jgi:hypothetical protein
MPSNQDINDMDGTIDVVDVNPFPRKGIDRKSLQVTTTAIVISDSESVSDSSEPVRSPDQPEYLKFGVFFEKPDQESPAKVPPEIVAEKQVEPVDEAKEHVKHAEVIVEPTTAEAAEPATVGPQIQSHEPESEPEDPQKRVVMTILQVIESYGVNYEQSDRTWEGFSSFIPIVTKQVANKEPVRMILPAFPFKSPNSKDKVIGVAPDLGEEFALAHINGLCENIAAKYEHGAEVHIASDGIVYNGKIINSSSRAESNLITLK